MTTHTVETISACQRRISVTVPGQDVQKARAAQAQKLAQSKNISIPGFRPGKPMQRYIEKNLESFPKAVEDVYQKIYNESLNKVLKQENLKPVWPVELSKDKQVFHADGSLSYVGEFEIYPLISHVIWENVTIEKLEVSITSEDIQDTIHLLSSIDHVDKTQDQDVSQLEQQAKEWAESTLQYTLLQRLKEQVIATLVKQNPLVELPKKLANHHYKLFKENNVKEKDEILLQKSREALAQDILIDAYIKEHHIELDINRFKTKLQEIEMTFKNEKSKFNQLMQNKDILYQLSLQTLTDQAIDHLLKTVSFVSKASTYKEVIGFKQRLQVDTPKESVL